MPFQKVEYEFPEGGEEASTEIDIDPSGGLEVDLSGEIPELEAKPEVEPEGEPEVEVIDDTPEKDRNRVPSEPPEDITEEELGKYAEKVQNRIRHFSKGYHDERRGKEAAQRERDELEKVVQQILSENQNLKSTVTKNREVLLSQAKTGIESELAQARAAYRSAHEEGDTENLLKAQERLTTASLKKDNLDKLEQESLQAAESNVENVQSTQQPVNRAAPDPKAVAWKEQNDWFGSTNYEPETAYALGLHKQITEAERIPADSNEYYEKLNSRMRGKFPELFEGTDEQEVQVSKPKTRANNVVAPATRSTAPNKIRLTQTQVALSKRLGLTPVQYAKQVAIDMRNTNG
tara:strand:- start:1996 stop:3039 length:1044 start_codon:yes stop_codon:yes gene_type:complete